MKQVNKNKQSEKSYRLIWRNPWYFLAFGFGLGRLPFAPGTFGTLGALPLYLLIVDFSPVFYLAVVVLGFIFGVYICNKAEIDFGIEDNPAIVWDEIIGFLLCLWLVPFTLAWIVYTFLLFRLLDIFKPWPIKLVEDKTKGGWAIMLDDIVAGVITLVIVHLTIWVV